MPRLLRQKRVRATTYSRQQEIMISVEILPLHFEGKPI